MVWFLIFYSTGAYFGKFKENRSLIKKIIYNLMYAFIFFNSTVSCFILSNYSIDNGKSTFKGKYIEFFKSLFVVKISALPMILQSISIMLFVTNINYNKYIAKIIVFISPLTFGIYLIHENKIIKYKIMKNIFNNYSKNIRYNRLVIIILIKALKIFIFCASIDYLRNILFRVCQIRRICKFIEKLMFLFLG